MSSEIKGLEDLIKNLTALPDKLEKRVIRAAVRQGANVIKKKAQDYVPVDKGDLKKSIKVSGVKAKPGVIAFKVRPTGNKKKGISIFYGRFQEFGTSKMAAHPFMRPAYDEAGEDVLNVVIDTIKSKLHEIVK
ncbi:MAG: HK97 gp10 family phage protein [Sulfuricurvum sp.]|nr:HK97 gp10 family phage protein [Sulfuricurvum sp.]